MKAEGWLFLGCAAFFGGTDVVYWQTSHDPAGTTALALSIGVAAAWVVRTRGRRVPRAVRCLARNEDRGCASRSRSS